MRQFKKYKKNNILLDSYNYKLLFLEEPIIKNEEHYKYCLIPIGNHYYGVHTLDIKTLREKFNCTIKHFNKLIFVYFKNLKEARIFLKLIDIMSY